MASYTRQSSFADGDIIQASDFNDEFNQLVNAFANTTGHAHDGTAAEGPVIGLIGDPGVATPLNKVVVDDTNNRVGVFIDAAGAGSSVEQLRFQDGVIVPVTTNDVDIGSSSLKFKDLHLAGTANIAGTVTLSGNVLVSGTLGADLIPDADDTRDIGSTSAEWKDLYIDGTAYIDALDLNGTAVSSTAAEINLLDGSSAGTIVNSKAVIYGSSGEVNATTLQIAGTSITSTAAELNIVDGGTAATSTTVAAADRVVLNDDGTMVQAAVTDLDTFFSATTKTLTNKTLTSPVLNGTISGTSIKDEDNMASDSASHLATQQSIKAYVDAQITAEDLDIAGDSGTGAVDLDSQSLTIAGTTNEIETSASGQTLTIGLPNNVTIGNNLTVTGDLTVSGDDITMGTNTSGHIMVADGTNFNPVAVSGDVTMASTGAVTIANDAVETAMVNANVITGQTAETSVDTSNDLVLLYDNSATALRKMTVGNLVSAGGGLTDVVSDTSPQLGGDLDVNGNDIVSTSNGNIDILPNGTGVVNLDGDGSTGGVSISDGLVDIRTGTGSRSQVKFYCESSNAHAQTVQPQPHSAGVTNTLTLPAGSDQEIVGASATQTLTNKTLTSPTIDLSTVTSSGDLAVADGGTGASTASAARTNLGLVIGTDVQAFDAQLADVAGLAVTDGGFIVGDGSNFVLETGATARTSLGLGTAAVEDTGTSAGNVVVLDGSARLPAVDGSQLTNLPSSGITQADADAGATALAIALG